MIRRLRDWWSVYRSRCQLCRTPGSDPDGFCSDECREEWIETTVF